MHIKDNIFVRVSDYDDQMLYAFNNGHGSTTFKWEWQELPSCVTYIVHQESLRYVAPTLLLTGILVKSSQ